MFQQSQQQSSSANAIRGPTSSKSDASSVLNLKDRNCSGSRYSTLKHGFIDDAFALGR